MNNRRKALLGYSDRYLTGVSVARWGLRMCRGKDK